MDRLNRPISCNPTSDLGGIPYEVCRFLAGRNPSGRPVDAVDFISAFSTFLVGSLLLVLALPVRGHSILWKAAELIVVCGSPLLNMFAQLTVILTIWNIHRAFNQLDREFSTEIRDSRKELKLLQLSSHVRYFIIESKHEIVQHTSGRLNLLELIKCRQSSKFWQQLKDELLETRIPISLGSFSPILGAIFTMTFSVVMYFSAAQNPEQIYRQLSPGLVQVTLWAWTVPCVCGWICLGGQKSRTAVKNAIS